MSLLLKLFRYITQIPAFVGMTRIVSLQAQHVNLSSVILSEKKDPMRKLFCKIILDPRVKPEDDTLKKEGEVGAVLHCDPIVSTN